MTTAGSLPVITDDETAAELAPLTEAPLHLPIPLTAVAGGRILEIRHYWLWCLLDRIVLVCLFLLFSALGLAQFSPGFGLGLAAVVSIPLLLRLNFLRVDRLVLDLGQGILEDETLEPWFNPSGESSRNPAAERNVYAFKVDFPSPSWAFFFGVGRLKVNIAGQDIDLEGVKQPRRVQELVRRWSQGAEAEELHQRYEEWRRQPSRLGAVFFLWAEDLVMVYREQGGLAVGLTWPQRARAAGRLLLAVLLPLLTPLWLLLEPTGEEPVRYLPGLTAFVFYAVRSWQKERAEPAVLGKAPAAAEPLEVQETIPTETALATFVGCPPTEVTACTLCGKNLGEGRRPALRFIGSDRKVSELFFCNYPERAEARQAFVAAARLKKEE